MFWKGTFLSYRTTNSKQGGEIIDEEPGIISKIGLLQHQLWQQTKKIESAFFVSVVTHRKSVEA